MAKKHWSIFVGLSHTAGVVCSLFIKKRATSTQATLANLSKQYQGEWFFINQQQRVQHTLTISSDLTVTIDGKPLAHELLELTPEKMTVRDQYGYHLVFHRNQGKVSTFYDEANDAHYQLDEKRT